MANANGSDENGGLTRGADGKFLPGWKGGPGRPADFMNEKLRFAAQMRHELRRRGIVPQRLADLAQGVGEFAQTPIETQLRAMALALAYSYGPPGQVQVSHDE